MKAWLAVGALAAVLAVSGCGGNGDKAKSGDAAKSGVPSIVRVGAETTFPPFEFTKDDYRLFNGSYFETQKSRLVEQKEYSYEFQGNNRHMYYFIEFRPQSNTYYKYSYEWTEWTEKSPYFEGREMFKIT